jgi:tetratricopeptide (TPR) repeat protein
LEEAPPENPAPESQTDRYFDQGVKSFEAGAYGAAAEKFHEAQKLAPDDIVLPFARVQALFAAGEYNEAVTVLREALISAEPDKEGVFYPRGLYSDEQVLSQQIEQLSRAVELNPTDSELRLLLGYQLLGTNNLDEAAEHLEIARQQTDNNQAATTLTNLLEKLRKPADSDPDVKGQQSINSQPHEFMQPNDENAKAPPNQKHRDVDMVALAKAADKWLAAK